MGRVATELVAGVIVGAFIGWVCKDVAVESADEIRESGLDWKSQLSGVVAHKAREWYLKKVQEID